MKKSLSMILSLSVAFSMFASFAQAAPKSSADFSDLNGLDAATKAKFDTMIAAGIFDGVKEGTFGLNDKMNRAQFAKVAALVFGLKVDSTLTQSSFADVKSDDPANGYALPYIEAIVKAGLTDGVAPGQYNPAGEVTKEQLATFLIRGLGMEAQAKDAAAKLNDKTVSDWAKGYVALALDLKLMTNGQDGTFGGTVAAIRQLLVTASYEAKQQYKAPFSGKYAVASFQATDANVMTVQLNGAVTDTSAVKLDLTKNGAPVTSGYTVKWSDDKTTATLTFDSKFDDATWNVTLGGVTPLDDANKTAKTTTTKEKVSKIEMLTTSDTLPNNPGKPIRIDFKATNQYDKVTTLPASEFNIYPSNGTVTPIGGEQAFYLTLPEGLDRNSRVSITVVHQDSGTQANKVFLLGDKSILSKIELGDLLNASGNKIDTLDALGFAYLDVKAYDQYGLRIENKDDLNSGMTIAVQDTDLETGNTGEKSAFVANAVGDSAADLKLRSVANKSKDVTISLIANGSGQSLTKKISIVAGKVPASVQFGAYNSMLAKGDTLTGDEATDNKMFVPIVVKDTLGNQLTAQEIYDNRDKLSVIASGGVSLADEPISNSGSHKGMIALKSVDNKGTASLTVILKDSPQAPAQMTLNVNEERKADSMKFAVEPKKYMIAGAENEMKVKLYDQYGAEMKYDAGSQYVVRYELTAGAGDTATLAATSLSSTQRTDANDATSARKYVLQPKAAGETVAQDFTLAHNSADGAVDSIFDKSFKFYAGAAAKSASYSFKATLYKQDNAGTQTINGKNYVAVNTLTSTMEVLDPSNVNTKLTYEAYLDNATGTMMAADDAFSAGTGAVGATNMFDNYKAFTKEVKVRAKKDSGEEVQVPSNIVSVSTSDSQIAEVASKSDDVNGAHWVAGGKAGQAKLTVVYFDGKKNMQTSTLDVTTKNQGPVVSGITFDKMGKSVSLTDLQNGLYVWDAKMAEKMTAKDQYADVFTAQGAPGTKNEEGGLNDNSIVKANGAGYNNNDLLKLSFYVSDIVGSNANAVSVDAKTGLVKYTGAAGDVTSFKVNVVAPSGVTASFDVNVK